MGKQYWADAMTRNCVWLFQIKRIEYTKEGNKYHYWETENIFLTREEANDYGKSREYAWGKKGKGWRIYGVPCNGVMADILGKHTKEFEDKVEYVNGNEKPHLKVTQNKSYPKEGTHNE